MDTVCLSSLKKGEWGRVCSMELPPASRFRLQDMGMTQGTDVRCVITVPWGSPAAYWVRGTLLALRREDAKKIRVVKA